jgi:hypothetical protein
VQLIFILSIFALVRSGGNSFVSVSYTAILFSRALLLVFQPFPPRFNCSAPRRAPGPTSALCFGVGWFLPSDVPSTTHKRLCPSDVKQSVLEDPLPHRFGYAQKQHILITLPFRADTKYLLLFIYTNTSHGATKELKFIGFRSLNSPLRTLAALWIARQTFHTSCCTATSRSLSLRLADREMASAIPGKNENLLS